jgi:hypothetical protein
MRFNQIRFQSLASQTSSSNKKCTNSAIWILLDKNLGSEHLVVIYLNIA